MKKIDVLIVFEHISRELDFCFILKVQLEKLGLKVRIISEHHNKYINVLKYNPRFIIVPFLYSIDNDITLRYKQLYNRAIVLNFHHEQLFSEETKKHMLPNDNFARDVLHLSWSENFQKELIKSGVNEKKIFVIGNPRTDVFFLKNRFTQFSNYKKIIFIPTTFSWAFVDENYFLKLNGIEPDTFSRTREITKDTAYHYFKDFNTLAEKHPNYLFVLRPHPFEDLDDFKNHFLSANNISKIKRNILITREGNIYDWLQISDKTVGWITTVNLEASLFKKDNCIYEPMPIAEHMKVIYHDLYNSIKNIDRLEEYIISESQYLNIDLSNFIEETFGIADGKVNLQIAEKTNDILKNNLINGNLSIKFLNTYILKSIFIDFPKLILLKVRLLGLIKPFYSGIIEDCIGQKKINNLFRSFKTRLQ